MTPHGTILAPSPENIAHAARILREGGLAAFPTETVYGLGANALDAEAVRRIYAAKGRPSSNPLIVHLASPNDIGVVARIEAGSDIEQKLRKLTQFWPGPLSIILPKRPEVPNETTAGLPSVAVRVPRHGVAQALIAAAGVPIAAPSANVSTYISPTTALHVAEGLGGKIDCILDGGPCAVGVESTIISLVHPIPTVLRHGGVTIEALRAALGDVHELEVNAGPTEPLLSPGLVRQHYAPRTPLVFLGDIPTESVPPKAALVICGDSPPIENHARYTEVVSLSPAGKLDDAARELFAVLRRLDQAGLDLIVVAPCEPRGLGRAIMDRLTRAAAQG